MTTGVVVFSYANWAARYPELAAYVASATAQLYFNEAQLYMDNTANSPVQDIETREPLLNMLTAHIAALNAPLGAASSPLVGRVSNASEGSVSVATEMNYAQGSVQWFMQTKYGAAFWQATSRYRTFRYGRGPVRTANPNSPPTNLYPRY